MAPVPTADELCPLNLHWMPTLAGDMQMVLADGKVLYQGQEVAFVSAKDRYIAADVVAEEMLHYHRVHPVRSRPAAASPRWTTG